MKRKTRSAIAAFCMAGCLLMLSACHITVTGDGKDQTVNITTDGAADYVTKTYDINDDFENISVITDLDNVIFTASEDGKCTVVCEEDESRPHTVECRDGTLMISSETEEDQSKTNGGNSSVTVYLPEMAYKDISVRSGIGYVTIGRMECENLNVEIYFGDIDMTGVVASGEFYIEVVTGSITFNGCDASSITATTELGDITGTLLSGKSFYAAAGIGEVEVPGDSRENICKLDTKLGNIKIDVD